jgi:xanthosine utilization system XapX-like protein
MHAPTGRPRRPAPPLYRALAVVPAIAILVGVPLVNHVRAYVFGLPFLLFWIVACVLLTSVVMAVIGALDRRREREAGAGRAADRPGIR